MKKILVRVPVRVDLAGGTLDLWPLYLFHPRACTVNAAISLHAECEIQEISGDGVELLLEDSDYRRSYDSLADLSNDSHVSLLAAVLEYLSVTGIRVRTRSQAPRGSGLGGSSAIAVALIRALSEWSGEPIEEASLIRLARDLETRVLGVPAGIQDYYPAVYGGVASIRLFPGGPQRVTLRATPAELSQHLIVHYSGVSHFSGDNNWEIYKKAVNGPGRVRTGLGEIARIAVEMEEALDARDFAQAGAALASEWASRKKLIRGVSTPEVDQIVHAAEKAGAWGAKVCGAGGGGCVVILADPDRRGSIIDALAGLPGRTLDVVATPQGLDLSVEEGGRAAPPSRRELREESESVEQLYVVTSSTRPDLPLGLYECGVTWDQARDGIHHTVVRTVAVPISAPTLSLVWSQAMMIESDRLEITRERSREIAPDFRDGEALRRAIEDGREELKSFLLERERLPLLHNRELGIYSKPKETRNELLDRCLELSRNVAEQEADCLESTFRRKLDQVRERFEKEQRQIDETSESLMARREDASLPWGKLLHDIMSGRAHQLQPRNSREADFLQQVDQLRREWDRDLLAIEEQMLSRAHAIEPTLVAPSLRGIELRKTTVIWTPSTDLLPTAPIARAEAS